VHAFMDEGGQVIRPPGAVLEAVGSVRNAG